MTDEQPKKKPAKTKEIKKSFYNKDHFDPLDLALKRATDSDMIVRLTTISELLRDERALVEIAQAAATGASMKTIGMLIGLDEGVFEQWIANGKDDPNGEFRALYIFFRQAKAGAMLAAEASLLSRNPDKWLDRYTLETELETRVINNKTAITVSSNKQKTKDQSQFIEVDDNDD